MELTKLEWFPTVGSVIFLGYLASSTRVKKSLILNTGCRRGNITLCRRRLQTVTAHTVPNVNYLSMKNSISEDQKLWVRSVFSDWSSLVPPEAPYLQFDDLYTGNRMTRIAKSPPCNAVSSEGFLFFLANDITASSDSFSCQKRWILP